MKRAVQAGETVYLLGIGAAVHNTGTSLVEVSAERGVRMLSNNEEERFTGMKHCPNFPAHSLDVVRVQMEKFGITPQQIHACVASWDYPAMAVQLVSSMVEELPESLSFMDRSSGVSADLDFMHVREGFLAPGRLGRHFGLGKSLPVIGLRHHGNHAYFAHASSPFAGSAEPVMVAVLDGMGDDGAISLYVAREGQLELVRSNRSIADSLGGFYSVISSTQGGWTVLSSEGRYMGAAAWGNHDRLTNPYYSQLRQLFYFAGDGNIHLNGTLANWHRNLRRRPYREELASILGPAISRKDMWSPDAVLNVDDMRHAEITQERLDKAAATQLVFEDALFHIVGNLIRTTGSSQLVLTGGTALNGVANMRLLEHFDEAYYERYLGCKNKRLHLWVPPVPGDAGGPVGAAYQFACSHGMRAMEPLRHAFYCGLAPTTAEITAALNSTPEIAHLALGQVTDTASRNRIADLMAFIVSRDGIIALFQGVAETGPRALGHRSIFANPCNPNTRDTLNRLVKYRERIRPLAPIVTREAAERWFELSPGASDDDYNAYNYMVLTVQARAEARGSLPAIVHHDGTSRIQIVRKESDALTHAYLKAMGRRVGVEVSVNTSLNVGGPMAQTPTQALDTLKRSKGMHALFLVGDDGSVFVAWHDSTTPPKDGGTALRSWLREWQDEAG
ncbi:MAG: carbamoyltransferase C-terminal domain-containing protein [Roseimicrobium sp.]